MARARSDFTLSSDRPVRYSPAERAIFALLREEPRTSAEIAALRYGGREAIPFNGRKIVLGALASLVRKTRANAEAFRIEHDARSGPRPMSFWLVRSPSVPKGRQRPAGSVQSASPMRPSEKGPGS